MKGLLNERKGQMGSTDNSDTDNTPALSMNNCLEPDAGKSVKMKKSLEVCSVISTSHSLPGEGTKSEKRVTPVVPVRWPVAPVYDTSWTPV
ncbi:hypothetical protein J6590_035501 [Homalodisca vitripennis]|nr:hypothetical protein J6590_035501 [Homalodisca vitripennis]